MRCPKCGYISFDTLDSCKKCKKDISKLVKDLEGTVFEFPPPVFLHIESETTCSQTEENTDNNTAADEMETGPAFPPAEEKEPEDVPGDDKTEVEETLTFDDFDDFEVEETGEKETASEIIPNDETVNDVATEDADLQIDFGDIDISDLAPPETDTVVKETDTLTLDDDVESDNVDTIAEISVDETPAPSPVTSGSGLEDLQIDDLDLDAPAPLVSGSKVGHKLMPSVKTGTALDDFDFDLGELLTEKK